MEDISNCRIEELCRTCCKRISPNVWGFTHIFEKYEDNQTIESDVKELITNLRLNIAENDGLPQQICETCHKTFSAFTNFFQKCKQSQYVLSTFQFIVKKEEQQDESLAIESVSVNSELLDLNLTSPEAVTETRNSEDPLKKDPDELESLFDAWDDDNEIDISETTCKLENAHDTEETNETTIELTIKKRERKLKKSIRIETRACNETCKFCQKKFVLVKQHQRSCSQRNVEVCKYCFGELPTIADLNTHINEKHPDKLPACPVCFATFKNRAARADHLNKSHNEGKYRCEICNYDYRSKYKLQLHNRTAHSERIDKPCPICQKFCATQRKYDYHMKTHDPNARKHRCRFCGKSFVQAAHLHKHELTHTGERPHLCNICGNSFRDSTQLRSHMKIKHGVQPPIKKPGPRNKDTADGSTKPGRNGYRCTLCNKMLSTRKTWYAHRRVHSDIFPYVCSRPNCDKQFKDKSLLDKHMLVDHSVNENGEVVYPFSCRTCSKGFMNTHTLEIHLKIHNENRPYKCESCSSSFKRPEHLRTHIKRIHIRDKKFSCPHCDKKFVEKGELKGHSKIHTDDRPFECSYCSVAFKRKISLTVHMRTHTGEKPYACLVCRRLFSSSQELGSHYAKHSVEERKFVEELILEGLDETADDLASV